MNRIIGRKVSTLTWRKVIVRRDTMRGMPPLWGNRSTTHYGTIIDKLDNCYLFKEFKTENVFTITEFSFLSADFDYDKHLKQEEIARLKQEEEDESNRLENLHNSWRWKTKMKIKNLAK